MKKCRAPVLLAGLLSIEFEGRASDPDRISIAKSAVLTLDFLL